MILIDANLLLYAYNKSATQHEASKAWIEDVFAGSQLVRIAWLSIWAFIRIATHPRVFQRPLSVVEAEAIVSSWLDQSIVGILDPGERYWDIFCTLMKDGQVAGPLVMDAALAALAMEHGATLYSADRDFLRFSGLKWKNPVA